jgi:hypothetical protein
VGQHLIDVDPRRRNLYDYVTPNPALSSLFRSSIHQEKPHLIMSASEY